MFRRPPRRPLRCVLLALLLAGCTAVAAAPPPEPLGRGVLHLPHGAGDATRPVPAVVLVHGTAGPDERYPFHRSALLAAGIATYEVDFKRGVFRGPRDRPRATTFLPWTVEALMALRQDARIDPKRIAIMGFSLGGHVSLLAADRRFVGPLLGGEPGFAAHVAFYPACRWLLERLSADLSAAPLLVLAGDADAYGEGTYCPALKKWAAQDPDVHFTLKLYPGVQHAFDKPGEATFADPAAIGGRGARAWNGAAAEDARATAVRFLRAAFGMR